MLHIPVQNTLMKVESSPTRRCIYIDHDTFVVKTYITDEGNREIEWYTSHKMEEITEYDKEMNDNGDGWVTMTYLGNKVWVHVGPLRQTMSATDPIKEDLVPFHFICEAYLEGCYILFDHLGLQHLRSLIEKVNHNDWPSYFMMGTVNLAVGVSNANYRDRYRFTKNKDFVATIDLIKDQAFEEKTFKTYTDYDEVLMDFRGKVDNIVCDLATCYDLKPEFLLLCKDLLKPDGVFWLSYTPQRKDGISDSLCPRILDTEENVNQFVTEMELVSGGAFRIEVNETTLSPWTYPCPIPYMGKFFGMFDYLNWLSWKERINYMVLGVLPTQEKFREIQENFMKRSRFVPTKPPSQQLNMPPPMMYFKFIRL